MNELLGIFPKATKIWETWVGDRWQIPLCPFATRTAVAQPGVSPAFSTFRHHHHLDCPSKIVLGDHRAFWVACRSRCVDQHASLVHSLLPGRVEPSLEKTLSDFAWKPETLLEPLIIFVPTNAEQFLPGENTRFSHLSVRFMKGCCYYRSPGKLWKVGCAKLRKLS